MAEKITNAGTTSLKNKSKEALEMSLHLITDSGRVRLPDCLKAQHAAVGRLSTDNKKVVPMESDKLWGLVADQRGGRAVPDHTRGNTKLLRQMWEGLTSVDGRQLPLVQLAKVKSTEDQKMDEYDGDKDEKEEKEEAAKKIQKIGRGRAVRAMRIALTTLGAAGAIEVKASKKMAIASGVGDVRLDGATLTLDCALADAEAAIDFLTDKMVVAQEPVIVFDRFWMSLRDHTSAAGHHKLSLSGALYAAEIVLESADSVARLASGNRRVRDPDGSTTQQPPQKRPKGAKTSGAGSSDADDRSA